MKKRKTAKKAKVATSENISPFDEENSAMEDDADDDVIEVEAEPVAEVEVVAPEPKPEPEAEPTELPVASYSPAPGDSLLFPGGNIAGASNAEIVNLMQELGIEGADHNAGRAANVAAYAAHIARIRQEAGDEAVQHFLTTAAKVLK